MITTTQPVEDRRESDIPPAVNSSIPPPSPSSSVNTAWNSLDNLGMDLLHRRHNTNILPERAPTTKIERATVRIGNNTAGLFDE
jgi:hypothetical protein